MFAQPRCFVKTVLSEENGGSLSRAHTRVRPYVVEAALALLFTCMVNWSGLFCAEMFEHANAFPRGEGGAAPKLYGTDIIAYRKKTNVESTASFAVP